MKEEIGRAARAGGLADGAIPHPAGGLDVAAPPSPAPVADSGRRSGRQAREEPPARQAGAAGWPWMTHGSGGFWGVVGHLAAVEGGMPKDRWDRVFSCWPGGGDD